MSLTKSQPEGNTPQPQNERVAVLRSAHGRAGNTFCTVASFIVSSTGARLLTGRTITKRASATVLQFPRRPRPTTPTNEHNRRAA